MTVPTSPRGLTAAALAAGLLLAGCSSDRDVPPTVVSAPGGGTQMNTDTGSGGQFPDVNTTPTQRPTSTIQDLNQAPAGLAAAPGGTQYGEALVGGPTSSAEPPAPPPPPEPPQQALAPIPEPGVQTQSSGDTPPEPYPSSSQPEEAPEAAAVQPTEAVVVPEPPAEPEPAYEEPQGEGQTIQGTAGEPAPQPEVEPVAAGPEPEPMAPVDSAPQPDAPSQLAPAPASPAAVPQGSPQQAQLPGSPYPGDGAQMPEAYGVSTPQAAAAPGQPYYPGQIAAAPVMAMPAQPAYGGEPVGLIYFRDGSSELSNDDLTVIEQIAQIQRAYGGVVNVIGHASVGGPGGDDHSQHQQANQRISEARANAVAQELMRYGVPLGAIRASAAGDSQPLYSEVAPSGEAGNRRVEVYLSAY
jgi:outer membrane protein OmpA-like peptidoglycan-associated protein